MRDDFRCPGSDFKNCTFKNAAIYDYSNFSLYVKQIDIRSGHVSDKISKQLNYRGGTVVNQLTAFEDLPILDKLIFYESTEKKLTQ